MSSQTEWAVVFILSATCNAANVKLEEYAEMLQCQIINAVAGDISSLTPNDNWSFWSSDICALTNCENGGICKVYADFSYTCECAATYGGQYCEVSCDVTHDNTCYQFVATALSWHDALDNCASQGGRLVEAADPVASDLMIALASEQGRTVWLGGSDEAQEGTCRWETSGRVFDWTDWVEGQPNNSLCGQHCLQIGLSGLVGWHDAQCSSLRASVCEYFTA